MSRKIIFILLTTLFLAAQSIFAQGDVFSVNDNSYIDETDFLIPDSIRYNQFYRESLRFKKLADDMFEYGDYDASAEYAREAIRYAKLSDEYVARHMIAEAKRYLDWADLYGIDIRYPDDYNTGKDYYSSGLAAYSVEEWNDANAAAGMAIKIFSELNDGSFGIAPLPSQYTVRTWSSFRDCLWNIAGYSWVYGDSNKWKILYEANKSKLDNPDNPDLIEPGTVIDIPSVSGEIRRGMWDPGRVYERF